MANSASSPAFLVAASAAIAIATASAAYAGAGGAAVTHTNWQPVSQVLEIPQACTRDGMVVACHESIADEYANPDDISDAIGDKDSDDSSGAWIAPGLGTIRDYEEQGVEIGPALTAVSGNTARPIPPFAYARPLPHH